MFPLLKIKIGFLPVFLELGMLPKTRLFLPGNDMRLIKGLKEEVVVFKEVVEVVN